ncbi:MAG TPA: S-methyl-5'-thioadenosine phosphorylase, partial [Myxococcaceae bacterium]
MSSPHRPMLGIIGGTGMAEALGSLGRGEQHRVDTPFGPPSSPVTVVEIAGAPVALLPRHGDGHRFPPGKVPYRANVFALKTVGVTHVLATAAAG